MFGADQAVNVPHFAVKAGAVYCGDDPPGLENNLATFMPRWTADEMRLMTERHVSDGMIPEDGHRERLTAMLAPDRDAGA